MKLNLSRMHACLNTNHIPKGEPTPVKKLATLLALGALVMALPTIAADAAFKVKGMSCAACEGKVSKALAKVEGVKVKSVDSETGLASVSYDDAKVDKAKLVAAIDGSGFKTVGEAATFKVSGMSCGACEGKLSKALEIGRAHV